MTEGTRQFFLGLFLVSLGAFVLVGPPVLTGNQPGKWEVIAAGGALFVGGYLMIPATFREMGEWIAEKVPFLHAHGDGDGD